MQGSFFDPNAARDPVWTQHVFWLLGQPEVILAIVGFVLFLAALLMFKHGLWQKLARNPLACAFVGLGVAVLLWGGVSAWLLGRTGVNSTYHDTYYVVAHFQYALGLAIMPFVFAVVYALFHRIIGVPYRRGLAWAHWLTAGLGIILLALPQHLLSSPAREDVFKSVDAIVRDLEIFSFLNGVAVIVTLTSVLIFAICLIEGILRRMKNGRASMPSRFES